MLKKIYKINNTDFALKPDLTLDESEEVQELFKNLFIQEEQACLPGRQAGSQPGQITGTFSNSEIKKFLSIALEPAVHPGKSDGKPCEEIDFGNAKESVVVEIIKDFFLHRIKKYQDFTLSYAESIKQQ